jgi:integrase
VIVPADQLEAFQVWLRKYGRTASTADRYAKCVSVSYKEYDDPTEKLIDDDLAPLYLRTLRAALKAWAEFHNNSDLAEELSKIRLPPGIRQAPKAPLSVEEWRILRKEINEGKWLTNEAMRAELGMMACRGFRVSDVLRIKKEEVEEALLQGVLAYQGKGRKRIEFTVAPIWRPYLEILAAQGGEWERVEDLISPKSKPKARRASATRKVERTLIRCGKKAGIEKSLHPHLLRHTYATRYYEACKDPMMLKEHMQWSNVNTALGYVDAGKVTELDKVASSLFEEE